MLTWVRNQLKDLKPEDFYEKFNYSHNSRNVAEKKLQELLTSIAKERNSFNRRRAKYLLDSFESWINSTSCELYWLNVEASLGRLTHEVTGRISAYKTIKNFTRKINVEERALPPSKRIKNNKPEQQIYPPETSRKARHRIFNISALPTNQDHGNESDDENIKRQRSDSPLHVEFVKEMYEADETEDYLSDSDSDYVYSSESSSCASSDNNDTVVDGSELKMNIDLSEFKKKYSKMNDSDKWTLSTGKIVEDALYNFGIKCRHEHLCHSFVIDPNDKIYVDEEVFTESELDEIRTYKIKPMPLMPQDLLTYLNSFRVFDISDLRNAILKPQQWDSTYNRQTHFDHDWIRNTMYNLLHEYEAENLERNHLELWFLIHIWSFIDRGFGNIDGVEATRSESSSLASSNRKNRNRTVSAIVSMKRKIMGRRGDLIIRKVSTEYGCSEAGKSFNGDNGTKLLYERGIKTPKMKDMFYSLCVAVGMEENKIRKLQSIGFIHAGLMILLLRLDSPAGYTCRVLRTKMLEIPSQITQFGSKALPVIMLAWKAKMIVRDMIEFVEQKQYMEDKENLGDQLQNLQNSCELSPPRKKIDQ
ncbi:8_t:CDS:10, partial [Dentiscutata erythropus]